MRRPVILFFALAVIVISCTDRNKLPKGILAQPKMEDVLWDMISAGEFLSGYVLNKDSVDRFAESSKGFGQVLQFHHISKEEFDKSYLYYRQHPGLMKVILDSLSKRQITPVETASAKADTARQKDTMIKPADTLMKRDSLSLRKRIPKKADFR